MTALLERLRETFGLTTVSLLERLPDAPERPDQQRDPRARRVAANVGAEACPTPAAGDAEVRVDDDLTLVLRGRLGGCLSCGACGPVVGPSSAVALRYVDAASGLAYDHLAVVQE